MSEGKKVILVTGGTGLVGKAVQAVVTERPIPDEEWIFVCSKDADLRDKQSTEALFDKYKPTHVLHLAALVGGLVSQMNEQVEYLRTNLHINDNVLQTAHEKGILKVVSCLSACIFPNKTTYPIDETMLHNGPPHPAYTSFAYAKRLLDIASDAYNQQYDRRYIRIIPCNVFGPHDNFHPSVSHVIPALMKKFYDAIKEGNTEDREVQILGSGKPMRQMIYVKDLALLILWVIREYDSIEPIILAGDESEERSISEMAEALARAFNFKGKIVYDPSGPDGQYKKTATNAKLRSYLPDFQFTPFEEAIEQTVNWYIDNYDQARHGEEESV